MTAALRQAEAEARVRAARSEVVAACTALLDLVPEPGFDVKLREWAASAQVWARQEGQPWR